MKQETRTFFITGVNGSGKSTLVPLLKKKLPSGYLVYDFDERGVPNNVDTNWRIQTTRYWLKVAGKNSRKNVNTVVCGLSIPSEIHKNSSHFIKRQLRIALLNVGATQIEKRLRRRFSSPTKVKKLKLVTGLTVAECIAANIQRAKVLRRECKKYHNKKFITSVSTSKETVTSVVRWIMAQ